jgi:hypothetical protein
MDASNSRASNRRNICNKRSTCNSIDAANIMDQGRIMDGTNSKANNRNISNSTSKSMDRERTWMQVTAGPATEETSVTKEAPATA